MAETKATRRRGVSLRLVTILMFLAGIVASSLVLLATYRMTERYSDTEQATQEYLKCQNDIYAIQDAVNGLDDRARNFVINGNLDEVVGYFNEVLVRRNTDKAVAELEASLDDMKAVKYLESAMGLNALMREKQLYAMRLAAAGFGCDLSKCPAALGAVELAREDRQLTPEAQLDRAADLLYSKDYTRLKDQTDVRINLCKDAVVKSMSNRVAEYAGRLERLLLAQRLLVTGMVAILFGVLVFVLTLVVYPIYRLVRDIRRAEPVRVRGSSEIMFLADTYNQMFRNMENANARLSYEAAHDALTGMYNRSAFESLRRQYAGEDIALLIVDVDLFKTVNDIYGHDVGDKVLVRVARVLRDSFRSGDKVCRIGGDEFAVIMIGATSNEAGVIRRKLAGAAQVLGTPEDGVPAVTFSVGCAFSDQLREDENLFKNADRALYDVKQHGRKSVGFFTRGEGEAASPEVRE